MTGWNSEQYQEISQALVRMLHSDDKRISMEAIRAYRIADDLEEGRIDMTEDEFLALIQDILQNDHNEEV